MVGEVGKQKALHVGNLIRWGRTNGSIRVPQVIVSRVGALLFYLSTLGKADLSQSGNLLAACCPKRGNTSHCGVFGMKISQLL
jgi:hypothetical protein